MNELALFAGTGGGILGGKLLGWRTVCGVEIEAYPISVLMQRQNEGILNPFPIWDDVCTFDGKPWQGTVDVVSGGFPCQDISPVATTERKGLDGEKSGLWFQFARIIGEVRPRFVFVENSARLVTNGLSRVLGSLAEMGYDAEWCVLGAVNCGGPHERQRTWIVARDPEMCRRYRGVRQLEREMEKPYESLSLVSSLPIFPRSTENLPVPRVYRSRNGVADRVDRTKAIGNGQVPIVAATAWSILSKRLEDKV